MTTTTTAQAIGTFCWPELCSGDAEDSKKFYSGLFGWDADDMPMPDGGKYTAFKLHGQNVGGMYEMKDDRKNAGIKSHWNSYVAVKDVDEVAKKAKALGGKVLMEPMDAPGEMRMSNLEDPTGAKFSVWQAGSENESTLMFEVGSLVWTELLTNDMTKAEDFYSELFGWKPQEFDASNAPGGMPYTLFTLPGHERGFAGMLQITKEMKGMPVQWVPYIRVDDTEEIAKRVVELKGKVDMPPKDIPTVGRIAMLSDSQGAGFAVIKTMMM